MDIKFNPIDIKKFGEMKSKEHNKMQDDISFDLYSLNKNISENKNLYQHLYNMLKYENQVLNNQIDNIKSQIESFSKNQEFTYINFYDDEYIMSNDDLAEYDLDYNEYNITDIYFNYNTVMPKITSKISKTFFEKSNQDIYIPNNLTLESNAIDLEDNPIDIESNDLKNAVNQDIDKFWYKRYTFNQEQRIDNIEEEITVDLSDSIFTNNKSNLLVINTYPNTQCNVTAAKYKLKNEPDYKEFDSKYIRTDSLGRLLFLFKNKDITSIKFNIKTNTPNLLENGTKKIFTIGLQNFALYNIEFNSTSKLFLKVDTEGIDRINDVQFNTTNKGNKNDIDYDLYGVDIKNDDLIPIEKNETISTNYNKSIVIEVTVSADKLPPTFESVIVDYELVD